MPETSVIATETRRRKHVWEKIESAAVQALREVDDLAQQQGAGHYRWIQPSLPSLRVIFRDDGADQRILVGMRRTGRITPWLPVSDDSQTYGGYPNLSDSAPEKFKEAILTALQTLLDNYRAPK